MSKVCKALEAAEDVLKTDDQATLGFCAAHHGQMLILLSGPQSMVQESLRAGRRLAWRQQHPI